VSEPTSREELLLTGFDARSGDRREALASHFGEPTATEVLDEARRAFRGLLEEIPYVGRESDAMAQSLIWCYEILPFCLALRGQGREVEEIGGFILDAVKLPPPRPNRPAPNLEPIVEAMRTAALDSQQRAAPDEFVYEVVDGDGSDFDYGFNVTQCAVCTAFAKHDAVEFVPYMCALDDKTSAYRGSGLRRLGTHALGESQCDFRFKFGGQPLTLDSQYDLATGERRAGSPKGAG